MRQVSQQSRVQRHQIEYRATDSLIPYENNTRAHPKSQIKALARSFDEFGVTSPLIIDKNSTVICGHARLAAAKMNKVELVPTIMLEHLTPAEVKAYAIQDNVIATRAGFSKAAMASELQALVDLG